MQVFASRFLSVIGRPAVAAVLMVLSLAACGGGGDGDGGSGGAGGPGASTVTLTGTATFDRVPFAAAAAARLRQLQPGGNALQILYESARDLGPPGRDEIYGYGLLSPSST